MVVVVGLLLLLLVSAAASVCAVTWLYSYSWLPSQAVKWTRNWIVKRGKRGQMSFFCFILKLLFPHMELPGYAYVKNSGLWDIEVWVQVYSPAGRRQDVKKTYCYKISEINTKSF